MQIHSEKYFPCDPPPFARERLSFVRLNVASPQEVADFLCLDNNNSIVPILGAPATTLSPLADEELIEQHSEAARALKARGYQTMVLSLDDDGAFLQRLSPRFSQALLNERLEPILKAYQALSAIADEVLVSLTIEELAPGGLDATDGVQILQQLERLGLKQAIIASGTRDFMPLFERRMTKKKTSASSDFCSHEPDLASAWWALKHTKLKIFALASIDDATHACMLATHMGLTGLVRKR